MVRTNRHLLRLFLLLVILMGLIGGWYADERWQAMASSMEMELSSETDWISLISDLAEDSVKFFQGATSESE